MKPLSVLLVLAVGLAARVQAFDPADYRMIDLTHSYDDSTLFWPTSPTTFSKTTLSEGDTPGGYFYSAYSVCTPEHGGTHLDAPRHFFLTGDTTESIPLERLVTPAVVIDVSAQADANADYRVTVEDVKAFEAEHGPIARGTSVLLRTGWSKRWPDAKAYLGDDNPGRATHLHFPSFGLAAATFLVKKRGVVALGVDTASIDYGPSKFFQVHVMAASNNVIGMENLTGLEQLPATGAVLLALPMKIGKGSGGPLRAVAMVPR